MSRPTAGERLSIARLAGRIRRRAVTGRLMAVRPAGWRLPNADELLLVPADMRPKDPTLFDELAAGQLGLAGTVVDIGAGSPFAVPPPSRQWARELNGFQWLGDLGAARAEAAPRAAQRLVADWAARNRRTPGGVGPAAEPDVIARRARAWMTAAGLLLEDAEPAFYRDFMAALGLELGALAAKAGRAAPGLPQLECRMTLLLSALALAGQERRRQGCEAALLAELGAQVLADGGHVSRNPEAVLELALDLLPLRGCYGARGLVVPAVLDDTIGRMLAFLRAMAPNGARLARFNGAGVARPDALAAVLAFDSGPPPQGIGPGASGYARLAAGATTVIVDCGRPPPMAHAGLAHAGCLSFELMHAGEAVIVNRGAPGFGHGRARRESRAGASHSTLVVDGQSSGRLVQHAALDRLIGAPALRGPHRVVARVPPAGAASTCDAAAAIEAWHDGWHARLGLVHERRLVLTEGGRVLEGMDRLGPHKGTLRLARDVPFAVHFHAPVDAAVVAVDDGTGGMLIRPASGPPWRLSATDCRMAIETAMDYAQSRGPTPARQIVLRATCPGESTLTWRLERLDPPAA